MLEYIISSPRIQANPVTHSFVQAVAFQGHGILCDSCLDDFESGMRATDADEPVLDRLIREHTIRARMPRFALKPEVRLHPMSSKPIDRRAKDALWHLAGLWARLLYLLTIIRIVGAVLYLLCLLSPLRLPLFTVPH